MVFARQGRKFWTFWEARLRRPAEPSPVLRPVREPSAPPRHPEVVAWKDGADVLAHFTRLLQPASAAL